MIRVAHGFKSLGPGTEGSRRGNVAGCTFEAILVEKL